MLHETRDRNNKNMCTFEELAKIYHLTLDINFDYMRKRIRITGDIEHDTKYGKYFSFNKLSTHLNLMTHSKKPATKRIIRTYTKKETETNWL